MMPIANLVACALILTVLAGSSGCAASNPRASSDAITISHWNVASAGAAAALAPQAGPGAQDKKPASGSDAEALAKQLNNPIADLISVPFQLNRDQNLGRADGDRWTLNVQPVVPFSLSPDSNLISRTILPVISQDDIPPGESETGIGDITQSFFFSPTKPTEDGWMWGAGPVFLIPTASDDTLGTEKWGIGPTAVALKQEGPLTYGALLNHVWSFAGDDDRSHVNNTFLQPFVAYTTSSAFTYSLNAESTYDWNEDDFALPVNAVVSRVVKIGGEHVSIGGGFRYWLDETTDGPEGVGFRFFITLLLPK
jgi:hypothetical protein